MNKNPKQIFISTVLIILGFGMIFIISNFLEKNRPTLPKEYEDSDLILQGASLKGYCFGFEGLIADWYWMKSLQYIGNKFLNTKENINLENLQSLNPRLLYPYLDNATTLDPKFLSVYQYGAVVLPAVDREQAIKLTEKGIANNPKEWGLYQHLGYIYWRLGNYEKAAEVYEQGSKIEGAPEFMKLIVARMKTEGNSRETAREIYRQIYQEVQDINVKNNAAARLQTFESLDEREAIQKTLDDFKSKNNRCINNWREILSNLKREKFSDNKDFRVDNDFNIIDPTGAPYLLDKSNCQVKLDEEKTKVFLN